MKYGKVRIILSLAILTGAIFCSQQLQAADGIDVIQAQSNSQQGSLLLDVREPQEYAEVHAPNAKLIPLGELSSRMKEIAMYKNKSIIVICHSGNRSEKAVLLLENAGFSRVTNIIGGMVAWERAGLNVTRR